LPGGRLLAQDLFLRCAALNMTLQFRRREQTVHVLLAHRRAVFVD
jgi:hypothetical protein